ncbi:MAG: hypothetical protein EZS28_054652, partial [Streblomastix strix]
WFNSFTHLRGSSSSSSILQEGGSTLYESTDNLGEETHQLPTQLKINTLIDLHQPVRCIDCSIKKYDDLTASIGKGDSKSVMAEQQLKIDPLNPNQKSGSQLQSPGTPKQQSGSGLLTSPNNPHLSSLSPLQSSSGSLLLSPTSLASQTQGQLFMILTPSRTFLVETVSEFESKEWMKQIKQSRDNVKKLEKDFKKRLSS